MKFALSDSPQTGFLAMRPIYQNCTNGYALPNKRAARPEARKYFKTFPHFTEIILIMPSIKFAQMVLLRQTKGLLEPEVFTSPEMQKIHVVH